MWILIRIVLFESTLATLAPFVQQRIMQTPRTFLALLLALLAQILMAAPASAKWLCANTKHFVIYSSGSASELQEFGANLERFDALMRLKFSVEPDTNPNRLTLYFLSSQEDVERLAATTVKNAAGFYSPRKEGSFAVANRERATGKFDLGGMTVLFHEYAHHFMFRNFSYAYPAWYVEGFAEYYSTVEFKKDGNWNLGKPAYHRAYGLIEAQKLPIARILFGDATNLSAEQADVFYGRSWLLVHMLSSKPEYNGKLVAYFSAIKAGKSEQDAATEVFGDLKAFDKALDAYLNGKLVFWSSRNPLPVDTTMNVSELDSLASELIGLHLKRLLGKEPTKTLGALRLLAQANPKRADIWYELALAERVTVKTASKAEVELAEKTSEAAVDTALAADPKHARANVLKANILFKRLHDAGDENPAHWSKARSYVVAANAVAVDDPLVLLEWFESFAMQGRTPSKTAHAALARAFELEPEVAEVRVKYALDLAQQGNFDDAIHLVEFLAHDPHNSAVGKRLLEELQRQKARAAGSQPTN